MNKVPHLQVDAFPIVDDHFSGVGHYTLGIIRGLDELAGEGKLTYSLISPRPLAHRVNKYGLRNYRKIIKNPLPNRIIRGLMKYNIPIPFDLLLGRGCYYFPSFIAWPTWFSRSAVVIHDVTYLSVPDCVEKGNREYLEQVVPASIKNVSSVITVSEFSRKEIVKYYDIDLSNVFVAYPSIDRKHFYRRSPNEIHKIKAKYDIYDNEYILSVGNIEPRKNYEKLLDAYISLPRDLTDKYSLVIIGAGGWNNKNILDKIQKAKEDGYRIINPKQFVVDADMPALYSGAKLFIFPSFYEGFGMPPLEAYACKTPVIASHAASIPEAVGKAAVYIDPNNVEQIAKKIQKTIGLIEKDPKYFNNMISEHLESLSWRKSAEITSSVLTGLPISHFRKEA